MSLENRVRCVDPRAEFREGLGLEDRVHHELQQHKALAFGAQLDKGGGVDDDDFEAADHLDLRFNLFDISADLLDWKLHQELLEFRVLEHLAIALEQLVLADRQFANLLCQLPALSVLHEPR